MASDPLAEHPCGEGERDRQGRAMMERDKVHERRDMPLRSTVGASGGDGQAAATTSPMQHAIQRCADMANALYELSIELTDVPERQSDLQCRVDLERAAEPVEVARIAILALGAAAFADVQRDSATLAMARRS